MPALVANLAPCITQVTFKLVNYALLINQLRFGLTFFKVLANFSTDEYGLDCGLELNAKVFQLHLNVSCFKVLKKCMNKFDCLVNEMLYIKQLTPSLSVQTDSIRAKVFV